MPASVGAISDVRTIEMDLPPELRPWDTDPDALVEALRASGGRASIAFKLPVQPRTITEAGGRKPRPAVPAQAVRSGIEAVVAEGTEITDYYHTLGAVSVRIDPELGPKIARLPMVDWVEPDKKRYLQGFTAGSPTSMPMAQTVHWGIDEVRAQNAWYRTTGNGAKILFIDSGHDQGHEDLPSVPTANCDTLGFGGCSDATSFSHGTHVMGIAVGLNNSIGSVGVAPGVDGDDIYVWSATSAGDSIWTASFQDAIQFGIDIGVDVMNMSFAGPFYDATEAGLLQNAADDEILLVAAAGNHCIEGEGGCPGSHSSAQERVYPGAYYDVLAISGTNENQYLAHDPNDLECSGLDEHSNYHSSIDLSAPWQAYSTEASGTYGTLCGTSQAAPYVTGTIALIRAMEPSLTELEVKQRLFDTAEDEGATGWDNNFGYGIVDAYLAVGPHVSLDGPEEVQPDATCEWSVVAKGGYGSLAYRWELDADSVGAGTTYETSFEETSETMELRIVVTDEHGIENDESIEINVDSGGDDCSGQGHQ